MRESIGEERVERSYVDRGRPLRRCSDDALFTIYKQGLRLWAQDPRDTQLMNDADYELRLRSSVFAFDDECRQIIEEGVQAAVRLFRAG